ncbi:hypothetical protein [Hymenobacter cellulosivorans]|uniref:C1q domain-containing protein n=1 Tax=Hymenobacter cellulosivorans TaxID=2932249 RepID=A0ABY4F4E5_9BACT|nr:hypothetical protein [Hymenobacter cellulosivorans]UOQ51518.1 hypothetical protein MUN80_17330 [Hymenobacter cellulosivorans]
MKKAFLTALVLVGLPYALHAQVSINTAGTAPHTSAMLDVSSTTKGLLLPRMTQAQRTAIASPATGLVVYQTDASAGLYCNNGTPTAPLWQLLSARAQPVYGQYGSAFGQPIPANGTFLTVDLATALEASGLTFNAGADQVTIITPGLYRAFYSVSVYAQYAGALGGQVYKNNAPVGRTAYTGLLQNNVTSISDEGLYTLAAGDVITLRVSNFNGGNAQHYGGTLTLVQIQ